MFSRWNLSRNPFDSNPISLPTLEWFTGRTAELRLCQRLVSDGAVVLVEGDLGVGTTSFGNVVRYSAPPRTPRMELGVYRGWNAQTLLENVLAAVIYEVLEDPKAKRTATVKNLRSLVERVEKSVHSAGVSLLGFGGQVSRNVTVTQPGIVPMETLRQGLVSLAQGLRTKAAAASFVIQLDNLDPDLTFTRQELITFLNDIRDSLQLEGYGWLLVGKAGLSRFITQNVPRLRSIIAHDVVLSPLSPDEVRRCVKTRIDDCSMDGRKAHNPIDPDLLQDIFDASGGSLRETFNVCGKLCLAMATDPLYTRITAKEAGPVLAEMLSVRLGSIDKSPLQRAILKELGTRPGQTQQQLVKRLGKTQTAISRAAKALMEAQFLRQTKEGRTVRYFPSPEVRLAADSL